MELYEALRQLTVQYGYDIVKDYDIIPKLSRKRCFTYRPELKDLYHSLINVGYAQKIIDLIGEEDWHAELNELAYTFFYRLDYDEEDVDFVFYSVAYGVGLFDDIDEYFYDVEEEDTNAFANGFSQNSVNTPFPKSEHIYPPSHNNHPLGFNDLKNLPLYIAMRRIIDDRGEEIITNFRFVSFLRLGDIQLIAPEELDIILNLYKVGVMNLLYSVFTESSNDWINKWLQIEYQYVKKHKDANASIVHYIFDSIAYGLMLRDDEVVYCNNYVPVKCEKKSNKNESRKEYVAYIEKPTTIIPSSVESKLDVQSRHEGSNTMKLHIALRNVIDIEGDSIINEIRLINFLNDFKAFDAVPASKYILRTMITDGYTKKLYNIGKWNIKCEALWKQFASKTGFQQDYIEIVFQSVAYGLGWIDSIITKEKPVRITNKQSSNNHLELLEIMTRARQGDLDAIQYCSQHKIDPFNTDSRFFFDYNGMKIGDWFYEDGSFSHKKSDLKKCVGVVFSLDTTLAEQADGWTHGLIVAVKDAAEREWGPHEDLVYPHTHYTSKDMEMLEKSPCYFKDYHTEYLLKDSDISAFKIARAFELSLPEGITSGWFLPSISQLRQIACNLSPESLSKISMNSGKSYWSSSQSNANEACTIFISLSFNDNNTYYSFGTSDKDSPFYMIRPIAAF